MKRKIRTAAAVITVLALLLTGCGKMTPEKLAEKVMANTEKTPATAGTAAMVLRMSAGFMGIEMNMALDLRSAFRASEGNVYAETTMYMEAMGEQEEVSQKTYLVQENGTAVSYLYDEQSGQWLREGDRELPPIPRPEEYVELIRRAGEGLTLDGETAVLNGRETYVLRLTLNGEQIRELLLRMSEFAEDAAPAKMDLSSLSVPLVIHVDKKTVCPVQIEMRLEGMNGLIPALMGEDLEQTGITWNVEPVIFSVTDISYEPQRMPVLPGA